MNTAASARRRGGRALPPSICWPILSMGDGRHQPGHRGDRLGATSGHHLGAGVMITCNALRKSRLYPAPATAVASRKAPVSSLCQGDE